MRYSFLMLPLIILQLQCSSQEPIEKKASVQFLAGINEVDLLESNRVFLRVPNGNPPIYIDSFQMADDKMFILDTANTQQAYIFNLDGTLAKLVGQPGPGPGEYRFPGGFCYSGSRIHIIASGRYNIYDEAGNFLSQNNETKKIGIGQKIYPAPNGGAYFTLYSRHTPNSSVFHVDDKGNSLGMYSKPDEELLLFWDEVMPSGFLVPVQNQYAHLFVHRYEVKFYNEMWQENKKIQLHSSIYNEPDFVEARRLATKKDRFRFLKKYSLITGFYRFGNRYVTSIANTKLKEDRQYLEFWDEEFWGLGRWLIPDEERLIGSSSKDLVFFNPENATLIFRRFPEQ